MKRIAVFASGKGTNAKKIIDHFNEASNDSKVVLIICNKAGAGVLEVAESAGIPTLLIEKEQFFRGDAYVPELTAAKVDFIVLAGFLWKMPPKIIDAYPRKIVNIHPALLPRYGGKGMYGNFVHEAVLAAKDRRSGITIHYVDEQYDSGDIIFQATCDIDERDDAESLSQKIHALEHEHYPKVIERLITSPDFNSMD
ncbi:MAG TPA: phosphoribosylglycinamide formyltransferase [Chitinophagaceae bacterium]|jgi:phosphoribosylglycinamide formyltransferase-1|nr:phosphoribosylglycinamide formyltransferase [Chitinophagaceae bacterium]